VKKPFWRKLENRGVQPIDRTEVEASQVRCAALRMLWHAALCCAVLFCALLPRGLAICRQPLRW